MMSVTEDKVFEDQIERMKQKNKMILERFQASEEDRKCAENSGSTINKNQNIQVRMKNDDQTRRRKKSNPPPLRPKSLYDVSYDGESGYVAYSQFNESRKQGKSKTNKIIDDEVAYQDYFHFQQTYCSKADHSYSSNRSSYHQSNIYSFTEDNYDYKPSYRNYQRSTSQKIKTSPRLNTNNVPNVKLTKVADPTIYKLDNTKPNLKEPQPKANNPKKKSKPKLDIDNNQNVDPAGDTKMNIKCQKTVFDDEYIDDTLEDLEKYRLKVDLEDFTVIDPECPNPILSVPLTSWTNDSILTELSAQDCKGEAPLTNLLNNDNVKGKANLNLAEDAILDDLSKMDLRKCNGDNEIMNDDNRIISQEELFVNVKVSPVGTYNNESCSHEEPVSQSCNGTMVYNDV